jgi:uncharacterized protein (UPF0335 family)
MNRTIIQRVELLEKKNTTNTPIPNDMKALMNRIEKLEEIIEKMGFYIPKK